MDKREAYLLLTALFILIFMALILLGSYLLSIHSKQHGLAALLFAFAAVFGQIGSLALYVRYKAYTQVMHMQQTESRQGKPMFEKTVLTSGNTGKLKELSRLFADLNTKVLSQPRFGTPECPESYHTFAENTLARALHAAEHSGLPAFADDSGICTAALNGASGVFSARYAGANPKSDIVSNRRLSDDFADKTDKNRYYVYILAFVRHESDPQPIITEDTWRGQWQIEAAGTYGFSYDPHSYLPEHNCTATELAPEIKNAESHRGRALRELLRKIETL